MKKSEKSRAGIYFLIIMIIIYIAIYLLDPKTISTSLNFFLQILKRIIPIFALVFLLMTLVNYYVTPQVISKYLSKSAGIKKWIIAVIGGIISTGPIYMWYPMLRELNKKGVGYGFISTFLYNRAIKPAILPLMIIYFGIKFTIVLTGVMIIMSIIQGVIFEKMEENKII
jgi:uncharacterized membrane protein YraQ (UPF0718 family)